MVQGHFWTILPHLVRGRAKPAVPVLKWRATGADLGWGPVPLSGLLCEHPRADRCIVIVHGLGGSADSIYGREMTHLLVNRGWSVLRLNMRGADGSGADFYHAALTQDLSCALASPELAKYTHLAVVGYSMGGHISLRYALKPEEPRVRGVCAISAPLDLRDCAESLDRPRFNVYRRHVLRGLKSAFAKCARTGARLPSAPSELRRLDSIRGWDRLVVVPRFGFGRVDDYYATAMVGPRLGSVQVPTLYLGALHDPMIPEKRCRVFLDEARAHVDTRWAHWGGHVAFPRHVDFGLGPKPGLEAQTEYWLNEQCALATQAIDQSPN